MEASTERVKILLNGRECWVEGGLTILDAARQNDIYIPTLCYHPSVSAWGGCRMCVVEVDGSPRLAASCVTPVRHGMEVVTSNERIIESRRLILEFLFAERNHNCMFCAQSGDCELQNLAYELQMDHLSVFSSFEPFPLDITNEYMGLDHNRCILCGRCVRACREITGAHVLDFINRGSESLISFDLNETRENSTCFKCGVCMEICPTGAIFNRLRSHIAVRGHSRKAWQQVESVCPLCGFLCPTAATVSDNTLLKMESRLLGDLQRMDQGQLCRLGRFEVLETPKERLVRPMLKDSKSGWVETDWETAVERISEKFSATRRTYPWDSVFGLISSMSSNEELLLFKDIMKGAWDAGYVDTFDGPEYRILSAARKQSGFSLPEAPVEALAGADFILVLGPDPFSGHPMAPALIHKQIMEKGAQVAVISNEDCGLTDIDYHLSANADDAPTVFIALLKKVLDASRHLPQTPELNNIQRVVRGVDPARISGWLDLDTKDTAVFEQIAGAFIKAVNPFIISSIDGTSSKKLPVLTNAMRLAFLKTPKSGSLPLVVFKPFGNSGGAWKLGLASSRPPSDREGWKAGLIVAAAGEPPDPAFSGHLAGLDFLAVVSPFKPQGILAEKADVLIPVPTWMEQGGTYTSSDGSRSVYKDKILAAPENVKETKEMLMMLAARASLELAYDSPEELRQHVQQQITGE